MQYLERKINVFEPCYVKPIHAVQGSNMNEIRVTIADWDIPIEATVKWQVATSTKGELNNATFDNNTIIIQPYTTTFSEVGHGYLQVRVEKDDKVLVSFAIDVFIQPDRVTTPTEGSNSDVIKVLVDQYVEEATGTLFEDLEAQAQSELASIRVTGEEVIASIPSDYSELEARVDDVESDVGNLDNLETTKKDNLVNAINEAMTLGSNFAYQPSVIYLYGSEEEIQTNWQNRDKSKMNFRYVFHNLNENKQKVGWCKLSLQGNATLGYPKHNFNIQFYKDAGFKKKDKVDPLDLSGDKHPKWTIKSNYNDYSQGRNVISARLWGDVVHSRANMTDALSEAPNHGAIDGHPVVLYMNDSYYGLYMFNMSKSDWMLGIDEDNPMHCAISAYLATDATKWLATGLGGWELEIPDTWQSPEVDGVVTSVQSGFTALQSFVINSTDADFYANLGNYLDVQSAIDYLIFSFCVCNADSMNKNQFLVTWNAGKTWSFTAYDMDQTFGAGFGGEIPYNHDLFSTHQNHLFERLIANFAEEILARYAVLRASVFSYNYVARELDIFFAEIPKGYREKDAGKWNGIMFKSISDLDTMKFFAQNRLSWCDSYFAKIDPSYVECTGVSIDQSTLSFNLLGTAQLTATKTPSNASEPIVWSSSNRDVATVSDTGLVTALTNGTATITATCGEHSATCTVTVSLIERGEVDYSADGLNGVTWNAGYVYDKDSGELVATSGEYCTNKFHLQDCLYQMTGGSWSQLYMWDADGNYIGTTSQNKPLVFSARSDYLYAVKSYGGQGSLALTPINNSATIGDTKIISISSMTGYTSWYYYNNAINSEFTGLISSSSSTLDISAVDWIYSDSCVVLRVASNAGVPLTVETEALTISILGSGENVEAWLYSKKYTTLAEMNAYLAEHPIMLAFNL